MTEEALVASALRKELQLPPRIDLDALARDLRLGIFEVDSKSFDGALLRSSRKRTGRILLRRGFREDGRRRFTIAHEIGHYLLHGNMQKPCSPLVIESWRNNQPKPELEADTFASELLLPTNDVVGCVAKRWPSLQVVSDIAGTFGTSMMAAARKFCDVAPQACAVVWSTKRQIRWFHSSPTFTHFIQPGKQVGFDTQASRAFDGKTLPGEMEEVPAEDWINSTWLRKEAVVSEQSQSVPFYEGCLSLVWVRRPIEDRPTEDDELLPELDPEGFTIRRSKWPR